MTMTNSMMREANKFWAGGFDEDAEIQAFALSVCKGWQALRSDAEFNLTLEQEEEFGKCGYRLGNLGPELMMMGEIGDRFENNGESYERLIWLKDEMVVVAAVDSDDDDEVRTIRIITVADAGDSIKQEDLSFQEFITRFLDARC